VQANAYVTPRQSQGFNDHYDVHDVFVLQVSGEKHWRIRAPVHKWPTRDQPWTNYRERVEAAAAETPLLDVTLREGDCLYLPRGYLHSATATEDVSAHLTLGVHTWTRAHLAEALVQEALRGLVESDEERAPLGVGVDVGEAFDIADEVERLRASLLRTVDSIDVELVAARLSSQSASTARPGPIAPLAQARRAQHMEPDAEVRVRPFVGVKLVGEADGSAVLHTRAGSVTVPAEDRPAVEALLSSGRARVSDLGLDLARHLLKHGVVT
jgi:hypothetical protein